MSRKRIYLCGKMSGEEKLNFPAFHHYAAMLRAHGHYVFNPAENDYLLFGENVLETRANNYRQAMEDDLRWICRYADAIALIPGWEKGHGTLVEKALADCLGLEVIELS